MLNGGLHFITERGKKKLMVNDTTSPYNINDSSIVVVSGLGGKDVRDEHDDIRDIWGNIYTEEDGAIGGVLICEFL